MKQLNLLCRSGRNDVEIYQCSCCCKIQINIGPVTLVLKKEFFFCLSLGVQKALDKFDELMEMDSQKKMCFRLGPSAILKLGFNELYTLGLCLVAAEKKLNTREQQADLNHYIRNISLN